MNYILPLPVNFLAAAMLAVSTEETRYYLNGVCIDPRGWLAATDGHRCFYGKVESIPEGMTEVIIPRLHLAMVLKLKPKRIELVLEDGRYSLKTPSGDYPFTPVDGIFPDWQRIIPANDGDREPGHYNPDYVLDIGKTASLIKHGKVLKDAKVRFNIIQRGNNPAPVIFPGEGGVRMDCGLVIMPIRQFDEEYRSPLAA